MNREEEIAFLLTRIQEDTARVAALTSSEPRVHPDVELLRRWLIANPVRTPTFAYRINSTASRALGRVEFYSAFLKQALLSLGYRRQVETGGIRYYPPA